VISWRRSNPVCGRSRGPARHEHIAPAAEDRTSSVLPDVPLISAITLAELSVGPLVTDDAAERARRLAQVQQAEADLDPLPFDSAAARAFGQIGSSLRRSGRKPAARALDALIAAIAVAIGLPLYTCNPADFPRPPVADWPPAAPHRVAPSPDPEPAVPILSVSRLSRPAAIAVRVRLDSDGR
jgi:predicted nucleic acid-binding protein